MAIEKEIISGGKTILRFDDISFWYNGKVNTNVPRIKTCALEVIETDFAPTGSYSTFSTGHPVQTRLSLGFREIEIITQEDVGEGY